MGTIGFVPLLWWSLLAASLVGASIYLFMEYQAYLLRTQVSGIPGGLRFTSRLFSAEARYGPKQVVVEARSAHYLRQPLPKGAEVTKTGPMTVTLPAAGLQMQALRMEGGGAGLCSVLFSASDELKMQATKSTVGERAVLKLDAVPASIASDFQTYANTLQVWLDKVEHGLRLEIDAQRMRDEQAEREAQAQQAANHVLSDQEREARAARQIEAWRSAAGFKGTATEVSIGPDGVIAWFIDMDLRGRAILHANKRTFSGSLQGAEVVSLGGELEVGVRDDYWTAEDPALTKFRILGGTAPDVRRAWQERLEILVQSLGK